MQTNCLLIVVGDCVQSMNTMIADCLHIAVVVSQEMIIADCAAPVVDEEEEEEEDDEFELVFNQ